MKPLSPRATLFILSPRSLSISHFSTYSNPYHHSSPPPSSSSSFPSRRHEEESRNVRVSVWWDFENCQLPGVANVFRVAQSITAAIRANGIKGPVQITAFGDMVQISRSNQEALSATGINLTHIPHGGKNSADRSLLVDLMYWVSQNPPPAHLFLISGDRDFAGILHRLRMNNYNILLASPESAPSVLCSAASIMWHWNSLLKGENLTGKYFNQPPDGPYGSWYGHYRVPLEDPFAVMEQPASSRAEEVSGDCNSDPKLRPVPKAVVKLIRQILRSYPKGVSIADLGSELRKSSVVIDKDLYGYKKFSRFLLSMPHILQVQSGTNGQHIVSSVASKISEPAESEPGIATGPEEQHTAIAPKVNGNDGYYTKGKDEIPALPPTPEVNVEEPLRKSEESQMKLQETPPLAEKVNNADETEKHLDPSEEYSSTSEVGFFRRMWRKWFAGKDVDSESNSSSIEEKVSSSDESTEKPLTEEKHSKSTSQSTEPVGPASFSSLLNEAVMEDKVAGGGESDGDKSSRDPSFFKQIINWCKFWRENPNPENLSEQPSEKLNQVPIDSGKHEVFLKESFWKDMEEFIETPPNGSVLVLQSRSREQMAQNLQKQGPSVLRSLSQSDVLHLVDLLISEKKWVEECPSQTYPFKINRPSGKTSSYSNPPTSNGLRSIFLNTASQSTSQRLLEHEREVRHQNLPHGGVSPPFTNKKPSGKSRNEILADCQKLVDDIVKEHPDGFNMGSFRMLFLDTFGYPLDIQKLGYQKLATLLQIMPGVKIESTYIVPCRGTNSSRLETAHPSVLESNVSSPIPNSDGELSDPSRKDDDVDSPWDELGPVANTGAKRNERDFVSKRRENEETGKWMNHDYETLADDYISDSDEENSSLAGSGGQLKPKINNDDSSLLRILDSWYSTEEEKNRKEGSETVEGMVDCSRNVLDPPASTGTGIRTETPLANCGRKPKPKHSKSYSFVSDPFHDNKDKLIDGILTSLKKSGESRVQG